MHLLKFEKLLDSMLLLAGMAICDFVLWHLAVVPPILSSWTVLSVYQNMVNGIFFCVEPYYVLTGFLILDSILLDPYCPFSSMKQLAKYALTHFVHPIIFDQLLSRISLIFWSIWKILSAIFWLFLKGTCGLISVVFSNTFSRSWPKGNLIWPIFSNF